MNQSNHIVYHFRRRSSRLFVYLFPDKIRLLFTITYWKDRTTKRETVLSSRPSTFVLGHSLVTKQSVLNGPTSKMYVDNPNYNEDAEDILYHFGISNKTHDLVKLFGDVKFVCCGGSANRMEKLANKIRKELGFESAPINYCQTDRYVLFKTGHVLCVNHGMGNPSISIMLHELLKLLQHARCKDVTIFRIGTSGGIGVPPGTIVVAEQAYNGLLEPAYNIECLGKLVSRETTLDKALCHELCTLGSSMNLPVTKGNTAGANDFYEGQGRLDGAFCCYTKEDKIEFLKKAQSLGIKNFEMEGPAFAAITKRAGLKAALVCVTLLDRLEHDQVPPGAKPYDDLPIQLVIAYIKKQLHGNGLPNGVW